MGGEPDYKSPMDAIMLLAIVGSALSIIVFVVLALIISVFFP